MRLIPFIVAALSGGGSLTLGHVYLSRLESEVGGGPKATIVIAAEDIPVGATLSAKMLGSSEIPQAYLERRHVLVAELEKIVGTRVTAGLRSGEALLRTDLAQFADELRVLSTLVPRGMRAVEVPAEREAMSGLLRPGDRIDLLHSDDGTEGPGSVTRTLVQNLMVLAVGGDLGGDADGDQVRRARRGGRVTISATLAQAQLITEALRHGRIALALRNSEDIAIANEIPETSAADVVTAARKAATPQLPPKAARDQERIENVR